MFKLIKKDLNSRARAGLMNLYHGEVETPVFMPVGTNGIVKTFLPHELEEMDNQIILANAYHLYLRPGMEVMEAMGGLHKFANWNGNILTDSGGFQIFSLSKLNKIKEDGVQFSSHIDGSRHFLSPTNVVNVQQTIGSDIMMVLDHCTAAGTSHKDSLEALKTTTRWAKESRDYYKKHVDAEKQKMFGIVQGNFYEDLRKRSAEEIMEIGFDGYAIGGLSVGEKKETFRHVLSYTTELLPENSARYLMGVGTPEDLFTGVENGIDMFDCVFPTRVARNAAVFTKEGRINLRNEKYRFDSSPLDSECDCQICRNFTKGYIRHLFKSKEISACRMTSYHNIYFMKKIMVKMREAILADRFTEYKNEFFEHYKHNK